MHKQQKQEHNSRTTLHQGRPKSIVSICLWKTLVVCFMALTLLPSIASSQETYVFERMWPALQQPWYFQPNDVAVDADGNIYVSNPGLYNVKKLNSDGRLITVWKTGVNDWWTPRGIAVGPDGYVYVVDTQNICIQKFTPDGQFVSFWGSWGSGKGQFQFFDPIGNYVDHHPDTIEGGGIAVDQSGFVYVTDTANNRVQKFESDGTYVSGWGTYGTGNGQFKGPLGIEVDPSGYVYVVDTFNNRVQKFTSDGTYVAQWGGYGSTNNGDLPANGKFFLDNNDGSEDHVRGNGITVDASGNVYVVDVYNNRIQKFTSDGQYLAQWGQYGPNDEEFLSPCGIAYSKSGYLVVAEAGNNRIKKFTADFQFVTKWGSTGIGNGFFNDPNAIAVDAAGNVYVTDSQLLRVQKFSPDGQFILKWSYNPNPTQTISWVPNGIAIDSSDNVYVADAWDRIQKFDSNGSFILEWGSQGSGDGQFDFDFGSGVGMAFDASDNLYVADLNNNRIQKFDLSGKYLDQWGNYGSDNDQLVLQGSNGAQLAIDESAGFLYIADPGNARVQKFDLSGTYLGSLTHQEWTDGAGFPQAIAVDDLGKVLVESGGQSAIKIFDDSGNFVSGFSNYGTDPGQTNNPYSLAFGPNGRLYVADTFNSRVQVFKKVSAVSNNKAIVVAGGGPFQGTSLWDVTQMSANFAYRSLTYQGFTKDTIYYLSSDTDLDLDSNDVLDDVDGVPSVASLQQAITTWASDAKNLVLYLVDQGGGDTFQLNETETLSVTDLDSWLDTLQGTIPGKVTVIYDAGSPQNLLSSLIPPTGKERIVISSTSPGETSYTAAQGSLPFSSFFWSNIFFGLNLYDAFSQAGESVELQTPLLDANGNGAGNEVQDNFPAQNTFIKGYIPGQLSAPNVTGTSPTGDTTPTWYWTSGGGGNGTFRYKLDDSYLTYGATETTDTSYTPGSALAEGIHTLYVQEQDDDGNWSTSGYFAIVIDLSAKVQPNISLALYLKSGQALEDSYDVNATVDLKANFKDKNGIDYDFTLLSNWVTSDSSVAVVTEGGVAFKANGKVRIIAYLAGLMASMDFIVGQDTIDKHHGNLIILAGGKQNDPKDKIKNAIQYLANRMYQVFKARGFEDDDIYYINHVNTQDFDGDGVVDGVVDQIEKTVEALQNAIEWARDQPNDGPLYLYLVDHGEKNGTFLVDANQILTAAELNASLDDFEGQSGGRISIIIFEACYSGSFVDTLSDNDRLVFTSSAADKYSYLNNAGDVSFSQFLSNYFMVGYNWEEAFDLATADLVGLGNPYAMMAPQKQIGSEITPAMVYGDFSMAGLFPDITSYTLGKSVTADIQQEFTIELDMMNIEGLTVWASVTPPNYQPPSVPEEYTTPTLSLDKFTLTNESGTKKFIGTYTFMCNGTYEVVYYVKDNSGNVISSPPQTFEVTGGGDSCFTESLNENWNLLSLPAEPIDASVEIILGNIIDKIASAWKWVDGNWAVYLPYESDNGVSYAAAKGFSPLTEISCGEGFWVNSSTAQTLTVSGTQPADTSCSLAEGWNLIGLKTNEAKSITDLVSGNEGNIPSVWKWKDNKWAVCLPGEDDGGAAYAQSKGFSVLGDINPGEGFWVNATQQTTLE